MNYFKILKNKIQNKSAKICIIGLGYVGSEIIKKLSSIGYNIIGLDIDKIKFKKIKKKKNIFLTTNYKYISQADIIIIAVPTPLKKNLSPDISYINNVIRAMRNYLKKGQLISLESTVYPGTTENIFGKFLIKQNFKLSNDFFLVFSPERISPELKVPDKSLKYTLTNTPKICSGYSNNCSLLGEALYKKITTKVVMASDMKIAETSKMIENVFRSINIALVNELKMFLTKIDIDIHEAINLAGTKPFGFTEFAPGPGYGGHCIPLDPFYLYWLAKKNNFDLKFIKLSGLINRKITDWITNKVIDFIRVKKIKLFDKKILILGVAYKKNIDDIRESPALKIMEKLKMRGYNFDYSDPYVRKIVFNKKIKKSIKITKKILKKYPITMIVTDHDKFDYKLISKEAKFIFDTRNKVKNRSKNYFRV